jgi:hypothetical protein
LITWSLLLSLKTEGVNIGSLNFIEKRRPIDSLGWGDNGSLDRASEFHIFSLLGSGGFQLEKILIANNNLWFLCLEGVEDLAHVEAWRDVDFLEVSIVCYKGSKSERGLEIQAYENWLLPWFVENIAPKSLRLANEVSTGQRGNLLPILVSLECYIWGRIFRDLIVWKFGISVYHSILKFNDSSDASVTKLNNLFQVGIILEAKLITWVEIVQLRHQFLKECLSGHLSVWFLIVRNDSGWWKHNSTSARIFQGLIKGINTLFFVESDNRNTGLECSHL